MTATRHIAANRWQRRGGFATRVQGHQQAKRSWLCRRCYAYHEVVSQRTEHGDTVMGKPPMCQQCQHLHFLAFDSKGEGIRFRRLIRLMEIGDITDLVHHPAYDLVVPRPDGVPTKVGIYTADSEYRERDGVLITEDFKPAAKVSHDPTFKLRRRMFETQYGRPIRIVST